MTKELLFALWFFLPAGYANATPIVAAKLPLLKRWNTPLDCGLTFRGKRVFGDSKTWRGLTCAAIVALLVFAIQRQLAAHLGSFSVYLQAIDYAHLSLILGLLLGLGALLGDAVESFFKRQCGIAPGQSWFPFDQVDYIIGACLLAAAIVVLPFKLYVWIVAMWLLLHLVFTYIGYRLHLKEAPI